MPSFWEKIPVDGPDMNIYSGVPAGSGPFPAVLVIHPASGVADFTQSIVNRYLLPKAGQRVDPIGQAPRVLLLPRYRPRLHGLHPAPLQQDFGGYVLAPDPGVFQQKLEGCGGGELVES